MRDVEKYLLEHRHLSQEYRRLLLDLTLAQHAYEESYNNMPSSCNYDTVRDRNRNIAKPVEIKAMIIIDQFRAEVSSIERRLNETRTQIEAIEAMVGRAHLTMRESEYVRLRYFSDLSAQAVAQRMYVSVATGGRIRCNALKKVEKVMGELPQ